ncbi:protein TIC110, chloroplastic-like [Silene latifolia]|uniref:protein TIC110, chloroplastic-like n=1 Tax=Silene latifolia TaxID=37657 RepID=UPI003D7708B1
MTTTTSSATAMPMASTTSTLLFSTFKPRLSSLRSHRINFPINSRRRVTNLRCSAITHTTSNSTSEDIFGPKRELSGLHSIVDTMSPPVRLAASSLVVAAALAAGFGVGSRFGGSRNAAIGGAVVLGGAAAAAAYSVNSCAPEVAAVNLHNYVASSQDPLHLDKDYIMAIPSRYGVSKQDEAFTSELCDLYLRFVTSVLPSANEDLNGTEVETIIKFKNSLGIDDPDAANTHIEIARRIFRQRLETGDREGDVEQRKAFQKIVYVSTLVFGEASAFLLPWKRVFKITDSQVEVAVRDNAQRLYAKRLKSVDRDLDAEQLVNLRKAQVSYRLSDELAEEMLKDHTRGLVEKNLSKALVYLKSRTRTGGTAEVVQELNKILAFNNHLISVKNHPDAGNFARGIGPVSLVGGEYDSDRKIDDLKLLYRAYVVDSLSSGRIEEDKIAALNQLKNIFGLGKREAEAITIDVTSKVYRKLLAQAVSSGDLEAAESKAAFLQKLCDQLRFDPQKASEIHEEIYRQKLQQCLADGELSEEDVQSLLRLRVMLCVPQKIVEAAHADICGSLFEKVVRDAIASGVDGYDADVKASVRKAAHGLRLTREAAISIASKAVRRIFINYIKQARAAGSRTESAKILKKMIAFNTLVVTELVADIKGESSDTPTEEPEPADKLEEQTEDEDEWESLQTLRKARPTRELEDKIGKPGQTEITVKDDLSDRERADLYKTYLLYCITGEVTKIPFGAQITTKKDNTEYLYLNQLGGILGLSRKEIVEVHRSLAEQAFRQQAEVILADGQMTKARLEQLDEVQKQVGLPSEYAQKVRDSIVNSKMAAAIETAIGQGRLSVKQIRELKEASVNIETMVSESLRENLYKKSVDEIFSSGTGDFDEEEVYQKIPADLSINAEKAKGVVHELARSRLTSSLVQAVALLRQRNHQGVVSTLNDLLACDKAVSAEPLSWDVPEELADLYAIYVKKEAVPEKLSRLQYLLGISDSAAAALKEMGDKEPSVGAEAEEFVF